MEGITSHLRTLHEQHLLSPSLGPPDSILYRPSVRALCNNVSQSQIQVETNYLLMGRVASGGHPCWVAKPSSTCLGDVPECASMWMAPTFVYYSLCAIWCCMGRSTAILGMKTNYQDWSDLKLLYFGALIGSFGSSQIEIEERCSPHVLPGPPRCSLEQRYVATHKEACFQCHTRVVPLHGAETWSLDRLHQNVGGRPRRKQYTTINFRVSTSILFQLEFRLIFMLIVMLCSGILITHSRGHRK